MFLSVLFHVSVFAFITSCYHCRLPCHSVIRLLILLVLYSSLCFACLGYSCLLLFFTQQLSALLHLFLVHCFAFLPCPFGRYAGDFQYYLKGFTNTMLLLLAYTNILMSSVKFIFFIFSSTMCKMTVCL